MELQDIINRVSGEFEFFHSLLDGVVFGLALLRRVFREVEVEFGVEYLPVFLLRGDVVAVDVRADGDTCHAILLLNIFGSVPFRQVRVHLIFSKGSINMFLAVIVELADSHFRNLVLSCISPYPFGIDLIFLCNM